MGTKRIYLVTQGLETSLIEAGNNVAAVNFLARKTIKASVASQLELVEMIGAGAKVLRAGNESEES